MLRYAVISPNEAISVALLSQPGLEEVRAFYCYPSAAALVEFVAAESPDLLFIDIAGGMELYQEIVGLIPGTRVVPVQASPARSELGVSDLPVQPFVGFRQVSAAVPDAYASALD